MIFHGAGAVWDKEKNRILCRFLSGFLETDDEYIIRALVRAGYPYDGPAWTEPVVERPFVPLPKLNGSPKLVLGQKSKPVFKQPTDGDRPVYRKRVTK